MNYLSTPDDTSVNVPKFVDETFVLRNNYYVVTNGEVFNSYSFKGVISPDSSPIIRIEKNPPVLLEGFAIVGRKVYRVSMQDLLRRVIRKSQEIKNEATYANDSTSTTNAVSGSTSNPTRTKSIADILTAVAGSTVSSDDESRALEASELEISEAADAAWKEQTRALLDSSLEEEGEWEIADVA